MTLDTAYKDTIRAQQRPISCDIRLSIVPQQVGTPAPGSLFSLRPSPPLDFRVVAGEQDLWNRVSFKERRPGEVRVLEQLFGE